MTDFRKELKSGDPCLVVSDGKEFDGIVVRVSPRFVYVLWGAGENQFTQEGYLMRHRADANRNVRLKLKQERGS